MNDYTQSSQLEMLPALKALDPPSEVCKALYAGQFSILGGLSEEELETVGLSSDKVRALISESDSLGSLSAQTVLSIWETSRVGDTSWLRIMEGTLNLDESWRYALAASWALYSPFFDASNLDSGPVGSRANALLHIASVDLTVTDIQGLHYALAAEIAEGKVSAFENAAFMVSSAAVGGLVGYLTLGSGVGLVSKAAEWVGNKISEADGWVMNLAERWLVASALIEHEQARVVKVAEEFYSEAGELSRGTPSAAQGKRIRMLLSAYRNLIEAVNDQGSAEATPALPDVVGMRLNDAKAALRALGIEDIEEIDAYAPVGEQRFAMMESKWVVRGQAPSTGTPLADVTGAVRLAYSRREERVLSSVVQARLGSQN